MLENKLPKTWKEYKQHIFNIMKIAKPSVLFQQKVTIKILEKYYRIGIRIFQLTDDSTAKKFKEKYPDAEIVLSIVKNLTDEELKNNNFDMYDKIVLPFRYCRQLQLFKELPAQNKYIIIVNSHCLYNCNRCKVHWGLTADSLDFYEKKEKELTTGYCQQVYSEKRAFILPVDLQYFDSFVSVYKLVDRLDNTEDILDYLNRYSNPDRLKTKGKNWYQIGKEDN